MTGSLSFSLALAFIAALVIGLAVAVLPVHWHRCSATEADTTKIHLTVAGTALTVTLSDNETTRDFVALLPRPLPKDDAP